MRSEVLDLAAKRSMLLSPEALELIMSRSEPLAFTRTVLSSLADSPLLVTRDDVLKCLEGDAPAFACRKAETPRNRRVSDIKVVPGTDVTGNSTCEGKIEDFARYFQSRYSILRRIIEHRRDFGNAMSIERAMSMDREVQIVGIVDDKRTTPNGHVILTVEDDKGTVCKVLILRDSPHIDDIIVTDQVIGIVGKPSAKRDGAGKRDPLLIAEKIVRPGVPNRPWEPSDSVSSVAFLSDVHIGSYTFLEKNWKRMIAWLKENSEKEGIDYIVFPGDVVDGIGVFPGQEEELSILDIYDQYTALAEYLKDIPDHIKMVLHPGNHDACRPAEPQPALNSAFTKAFDSNIMLVGNPVYVDIEGRTILSYHGKSLDDWIAGVRQLTYDDPIAVMREMASMRHLAPIYGQKTALAPERKDYMAMETVPDIFVSGHVHGSGYAEYRGMKLINASTWQDQTEYQRMHNFNPDPGIMPIVHLGTGKTAMMSFMRRPRKGEWGLWKRFRTGNRGAPR